MAQQRRRRAFSSEYKQRVVRMVVGDGQSVPAVCRDQDLGETVVRRWVDQLKVERTGQSGEGHPLTAEQQRIRQRTREPPVEGGQGAPKKSIGLLRPGTQVMHRCITYLRGEGNTRRLCELLGVSRSGYYAARARADRPRTPCAVGVRLERVFTASGRTYGTRRLAKALQAEGIQVGRYRARTLMRERGLRPIWQRRFVTTTRRDERAAVAENHLDRQFSPAGPDQAWVSDITYIPTTTGWCYLAVILDLYSRKVVGWALERQMPASLACEALRMALAHRRPAPGLLLHSDQGCQYTSDAWQRLLADHGLRASMSRRGNCWDNAVAERFFLSLKMERVWQRRYANQGEARRDIADYIVSFYNAVRIHSTLGYLSIVPRWAVLSTRPSRRQQAFRHIGSRLSAVDQPAGGCVPLRRGSAGLHDPGRSGPGGLETRLCEGGA